MNRDELLGINVFDDVAGTNFAFQECGTCNGSGYADYAAVRCSAGCIEGIQPQGEWGLREVEYDIDDPDTGEAMRIKHWVAVVPVNLEDT